MTPHPRLRSYASGYDKSRFYFDFVPSSQECIFLNARITYAVEVN